MKALRAQDPNELHEKIVEAVGLSGAPSLSDVEYWIAQASALDIVEEPEPVKPLKVIR